MQNFIGDNINAFRVNKGLTQTDFAKTTGVSQSAISAWERGESTPQAHHIQSIIDTFPELSADDILSEKFGYAKIVLAQPSDKTEPTIEIPLFGSIAAGKPLEMLDVNEKHPLPVSIFQKHPNAFYLKVTGESMNRVLPNGSYALIDPTQRETQDGRVFAVSVDNSSATIKRIHILEDGAGFELQPDSYDPSFKPTIFKHTDQTTHTLKTIGLVVWYTIPYGRPI